MRTGCHSPPEDPSEEGGVEALWGRQPPLHLRDGDFVLGRRAEEGEAPRHGAEDVGRRRAHDPVLDVHDVVLTMSNSCVEEHEVENGLKFPPSEGISHYIVLECAI